MAKIVTNPAGIGSLTDHGTTQLYPLGTIVEFQDSTLTYGPGEAIYLKGLDSTVAGSLVTWTGAGQTALGAAKAKGSVGVALSACVTGEYGWYVITGNTSILADTTAAQAQLYLDATTAATVDDAIVAGDFIAGATSTTATSSGAIVGNVNRSAVTDADNT